MKTRKILGIIAIFSVVISGSIWLFYVIFWLGFVGGIVQIISEIRRPAISSLNVLIGVIRIIIAMWLLKRFGSAIVGIIITIIVILTLIKHVIIKSKNYIKQIIRRI